MTHYLNDDEWWTDSNKVKHAISDMPADYAQNIYNLLTRKADKIAAEYSLYLARTTMPNGDMAADAVERAIDGEVAQMRDNVYLWLTSKPLMQALMWRMDIQPLKAACWCGHAAGDHIIPTDDPRPLCIGCTRRPIGTTAVPAEAFHRMDKVRPSDDELEANSRGVRYDDAFKDSKRRERAAEAERIREKASELTGLAANRVLDNPILEFEPVEAEEGDEYRVFLVTTGWYSDFGVESVFIGDRNGAYRRAHLLRLRGEDHVEVDDRIDENHAKLDASRQLPDDPEVLIARYRTRVNTDGGNIIDMSAESKIVRQSDVEPTKTTVTHITPTTATRWAWRHEVEIATQGPVSDLERIRKSHSERVAFVRAALIEGVPFEE